MNFKVANMRCEHCVRTLTRALKALDPESSIEVDLASARLSLESRASAQAAIEAMGAHGYAAKLERPQPAVDQAPDLPGDGRPWFPHLATR